MGRRLQTADPLYQTHEAYYKNVAVDQDVNIIENVPEYHVQLVRNSLHGFHVTDFKLDPRIFGMGTARARVYLVCIRSTKLKWKKGWCWQTFLDALTANKVLVSGDYWWRTLPSQTLSQSDVPWLRSSRSEMFIIYDSYVRSAVVSVVGTGIKGRDLCFWNLKLSLLLLYRNNLSLLQSFRDDSLLEMLILEVRNLKEYGNTRYKHVFDLGQLARNNRGRGETKDNALCTLTTNSGKLFSKAVSVKT